MELQTTQHLTLTEPSNTFNEPSNTTNAKELVNPIFLLENSFPKVYLQNYIYIE